MLKVYSFNKVDLTIPCNLRDAKQNFSATILLKPQLAQQQESTMKKWQNPLVGFHIDQSCIFHIWPKPNIHLWKTLALGTEDGRFTSICLLYGQLSQGRMANFPAFIASKSFDLWKHHIPYARHYNPRLVYILPAVYIVEWLVLQTIYVLNKEILLFWGLKSAV